MFWGRAHFIHLSNVLEFGVEVGSEEMCPLISFNQRLKSVFFEGHSLL